MNRIFRYMLSAALILPWMSSCSDDDNKYVPAEKEADDCPGVYFDKDNGKDFLITPDDGAVIEVKMHRLNTRGAIDVPLTASTTLEGITVPSTVHFNDGSADATLTIDCSAMPARKSAAISMAIPDEYVNHYAAQPFDYRASVLLSKWESANADGSKVTLYFTDQDYVCYPASTIKQVCYKPIECEMQVLPGAGLIRISNFLCTGIDMTFKLTPSEYTDYAGLYRVSPQGNMISMVDTYEDESYGDEWYNAWYVFGWSDEEGEDDYLDANLTDLGGNSSVLEWPQIFWYSDTYLFEYSVARLKGNGTAFNAVSLGLTGTPDAGITLPSYFYVYFTWDGESSL